MLASFGFPILFTGDFEQLVEPQGSTRQPTVRGHPRSRQAGVREELAPRDVTARNRARGRALEFQRKKVAARPVATQGAWECLTLRSNSQLIMVTATRF